MKKKVHVVGAVIINEKNEILCAQRSLQMDLPNLWEFPGGKIESNETPQQALVREIHEELLCEIEVFQKVADSTFEYEAIIVRLETYTAKIIKGTPTASEHSQLIWSPIAALHNLDWAAADIPAIEKIQKGGIIL